MQSTCTVTPEPIRKKWWGREDYRTSESCCSTRLGSSSWWSQRGVESCFLKTKPNFIVSFPVLLFPDFSIYSTPLSSSKPQSAWRGGSRKLRTLDRKSTEGWELSELWICQEHFVSDCLTLFNCFLIVPPTSEIVVTNCPVAHQGAKTTKLYAIPMIGTRGYNLLQYWKVIKLWWISRRRSRILSGKSEQMWDDRKPEPVQWYFASGSICTINVVTVFTMKSLHNCHKTRICHHSRYPFLQKYKELNPDLFLLQSQCHPRVQITHYVLEVFLLDLWSVRKNLDNWLLLVSSFCYFSCSSLRKTHPWLYPKMLTKPGGKD